MKKKFVIFILSLSITSTLSMSSYFPYERTQEVYADSKQDAAQQAYEQLTELLKDNSEVYSYYGGSYINNEDILMVNLTTEDTNIKETIQNATSSQDVLFRKVDYTYQHLIDILNTLYEKWTSEIADKYQIKSTYADPINNKVIIEIGNLSLEDEIRANLVDDPSLSFVLLRGEITTDTLNLKAYNKGDKAEYQGITYQITKKTDNTKTVKVISVSGNTKKTISVPQKIVLNGDTYKVTAIGKNSFKNKTQLKKVIIGKNVKKIANNSFVNCKKLKKIIINNKKCKYSSKILKNCNKNCTITIN